MDVSLLIVAGVLLIAGVLETIFDRRRRVRDRQWMAGTATTEGVVSRVIEKESFSTVTDQTTVVHIAVVLFRAPNGVQYEFEAQTEVGPVGSKVPVAYNPKLPSDAREIPSEKSNHYRGGCGLILAILAIALAVKAIFFAAP